jgi:Mn-containing catalase
MSEQKTGAELIAAERERQVTKEGWTAEHDLGRAHQLVDAAKCYLRAGTERPGTVPIGWPWAGRYWKPTGDPIRDLTKAGALIAAAIDSLAKGAQS